MIVISILENELILSDSMENKQKRNKIVGAESKEI